MQEARVVEVSTTADPQSQRPTFVDANALKRYLANEQLGRAMGHYFHGLCKLRDSMDRDYLAEQLSKIRKDRLERLQKLRGTRNDRSQNHRREGRGWVRGDGDG